MAGLIATSDGETASGMGAELRQLSEAYLSGLPIELGYLARRFLTEHGEPLRELLHTRRLPLADTLARELTDELDRQQLTQELTGPCWKAGATLDRDELARQVRVIDSFLARNDYATAFGLMREWLVLWTMWRLGIEAGWLDYYARKPAEALLRRITDRAERLGRWSRPLTGEQVTIGRVWGALHKLRNRYAHHGMDKYVTLSTDPGVEAHVETILWVWRGTLRGVPEFSLDLPPPERRLLVSPIGTRPGVLFSALHRANPAQVSSCLVICSAETERAVRPAVEAAGYRGEVIVLRFSDPFAGTNELDLRVKEAKQHVRDAEEVLVNVTGGTTLMGVLAERIAGKARGFGRAAHRFALVDRRPPAEQETDPYQVGEVCWLDDPPGEGGGA